LSKTVKIVWTATCLLVLAVTIYGSKLPESRDNGLVMVLAMAVLCFPSAYVIAYAYSGISSLSPAGLLARGGESYIAFVITWLGFFAAGYVQWFVLLPMVIRNLRRRSGPSSSDTPIPPRSA
jgi:hypothetical protein